MWKKPSIFGPTKSFRLKQPYEYYKLQKKSAHKEILDDQPTLHSCPLVHKHAG